MKLLVASIVAVGVLACAQAAQAAEAVAIELPAGRQVRLGEYFPVVIALQETAGTPDTEIHLTAGKLTFFEQVSMSAGTSRKVLVRVVVLQEHPEITLELRCAGERAQYTRLARKLERELKVVPRQEHLVGILSDVPNPELARLFQQDGVTRVELSPGLEFPAEVFRVFDLIAFDALLWQSMGRQMTEALEAYVKSGGSVFMSNHETAPPPTGSDKMVWSMPRGLGNLYLLNPRYSRIPGHGHPEVKQELLVALGMARPRRAPGRGPSQLSGAFEPPPRHLDARPRWAAYLLISALSLAAGALCSMLRLWSRRTGQMLMPALAVCLSCGFVIVAPAGSVAYESLSLVIAAADSDVIVRRSYVHLYSFADCAEETYRLGADGLIVPLVSGWRSRREFSPVLHNGDNVRVSRLCFKKSGAAVFEMTRPAQFDGAFHVSGRPGAIRITNNSGFDLYRCVLVRSGMITELGGLRFGDAVKLPEGEGEYMQKYLTRLGSRKRRVARVVASFVGYALKRFVQPGRTYMAGWTWPRVQTPPGYAQAADMGTMWIIEIPAADNP